MEQALHFFRRISGLVTPLAPAARLSRDTIFTIVVGCLTLVLICMPSGFERPSVHGVMARAEILSVDNHGVKQIGFISVGAQLTKIRVLDGPYAGTEVDGSNTLVGKLEMDKFFRPGDTALVGLDVNPATGKIAYANVIDHYRLYVEALLFALFACILLIFAGMTGAKALVSFVFSIFMVWKVLLPLFLKGYEPVFLSLGVTMSITAVIIFLVGGLTRRGSAAFLGAAVGIGSTCVLAVVFGYAFHIHGAVRPFSETLLYSGYEFLDLTKIFFAGIFIASSGAVMDVAMDVAASIEEVHLADPSLSRTALIASGMKVGRAVIGTMTTTLLLAYSGGYTALLLVFMAQGTPIINILNLTYVAAEILHTLVGSFGVVLVAPATAVIGGFLYGRRTPSPR
ncbi:MAG: YibE/F family protein [Desulforhopalus sp.]|nr:YibE/F family protein [Desulforhopalus sp.]